MTPEQDQRATLYASLPAEVRQAILDDLATHAQTTADPLVRAGRTDAALFLLLRFSEKRRHERARKLKGTG